MSKSPRVFLMAAAVMLASLSVTAQNTIKVHGFGGWAYGRSDELQYSLAKQNGSINTAEIGLNVTTQLGQKLRFVTQGTRRPEYEGGKTVLDYAFAEYAVSDALKLRAGRVKHPFGLYGEVFHIGTLRPLYTLPHSIYGATGFTAQSYDGGGITGQWQPSAWTFQYDAYAGKMRGDFSGPGLIVSAGASPTQPILNQGFKESNVFGGRFQAQPPLAGLSFAVSAYKGDLLLTGVGLSEKFATDAEVFSAEYVKDQWLARGEWGRQRVQTQLRQSGGYVELAYRLAPKWQVASRWDKFHATVDSLSVPNPLMPPFMDQLLEHRETGFGVNYWIHPNVVVRANYLLVKGNRWAYPDNAADIVTALMTGQLRNDARAFVIGAQFSF